MDGKLFIRIVAAAGLCLTVICAVAAQPKASEPFTPAQPDPLSINVTPPSDQPKPKEAASQTVGKPSISVQAPNAGSGNEQPIPSELLFALFGISALTILSLGAHGIWFSRLKALQGDLDQVRKTIDDLIATKKQPASPAATSKPQTPRTPEPLERQNLEVAGARSPQLKAADEEVAFMRAQRTDAPAVRVEREPPRQPVRAPPKPPEISRLALVQAVMEAVKQVAESGLSLTASNAATKVAGQISDPAIRSALAAQSFALDFFDAAGAPTAQGAELMVIGLGGSREREVLPFPNAGRVGRFMNWFDNPRYQTDPLLAEEPALAEVDSAGNLVKLTNGILA